MEGKWNRSGIRYRDGAIHWNGLTLPVLVKKQDTYAQMALCSRVKYCRLKRIVIRGAVRYIVQLVLEGIPPHKLGKQGQFKHTIGQGKTGCDIGTQTAAIVSDTKVTLHLLAPRVQRFEEEKRRIQRRMDRSTRAMNPDRFHPDKTVKQGKHTPWVRSKRYMKDLFRLKEICRKQTDIRKQDHYRLANEWLAQGNEFYVETMNYKALAQPAKKTIVDEKTGKTKRKKRLEPGVPRVTVSNGMLAQESSVEFRECLYVVAGRNEAHESIGKAEVNRSLLILMRRGSVQPKGTY